MAQDPGRLPANEVGQPSGDSLDLTLGGTSTISPAPRIPRAFNGSRLVPMVGDEIRRAAMRERTKSEVVVPKMKSNRAAKKRFKITGSGRVRRSKGGLNHNMQEKSRKRLRRLRKNDMVDGTMEKRVKLMLPYG